MWNWLGVEGGNVEGAAREARELSPGFRVTRRSDSCLGQV